MAFNRDQWIESFEGQMTLLRPHLAGRLLGVMSNMAWHARGSKGEDPIEAAKAEAVALDQRAKKGPASRP